MRAIEDDAPDMLREGLDLSIVRAERVQPPDRLLFAETLFPVCSPSLGPPQRAEALLGHNLLEEASSSVERSWSHWLGLLQEDPSRARIVRFSSFNQAIGAPIAGAGIALGRSHLVQEELATGRLVRLFAPLALPDSAVFVLRTRPGRARDVHVAQLRDSLITEAQSADAGIQASKPRPRRPRAVSI